MRARSTAPLALALALVTALGALPASEASLRRGPRARVEHSERITPAAPRGPGRLLGRLGPAVARRSERGGAVGWVVRHLRRQHRSVVDGAVHGKRHTKKAILQNLGWLGAGSLVMGSLGVAGAKLGFDGEHAALAASTGALGLAFYTAIPKLRAAGKRLHNLVAYVGVPSAIYGATLWAGHWVGNLAHGSTNLVTAFFAAVIIGADIGPVLVSARATHRENREAKRARRAEPR